MDLFTIICIIAAILVAGVFLLLLYSGFFYTYTIRCTMPASIPTSYAYIVHTGPYEGVGKLFGNLGRLTPTRTLFGVYYDDPNKVPAAQLRCIIGCDLTKPASKKEQELLEKNGYSFSSFPECKRALVTEFPFRNYLSIWIAVRRVYPSLMEYIEKYKLQNAGPCMEIYKNDAIQFVVVLDNNEGFYVPEIPEGSSPMEAQDEGSKKTN